MVSRISIEKFEDSYMAPNVNWLKTLASNSNLLEIHTDRNKYFKGCRIWEKMVLGSQLLQITAKIPFYQWKSLFGTFWIWRVTWAAYTHLANHMPRVWDPWLKMFNVDHLYLSQTKDQIQARCCNSFGLFHVCPRLICSRHLNPFHLRHCLQNFPKK